MTSRCLVASFFICACILAAPSAAVAQEGVEELCSLFLHQQQTELEDFELALRMNETRLAVAEEIFDLLDDMWRNDLVERLPYLGVKYRRDVAAIDLERTRWQLARQQAAVQQYELSCVAPADRERASEDGDTAEDAYGRYVDADCAVRALDVDAFEVELAYQEELLRSSIDLRRNDIATRQQVLIAERDVELTRQQLEQARLRTERCRR